MNYLAHLYFAQPTAESHFGNLLGDFGGKVHTKGLSNAVLSGLNNHYLVDKFTDNHPEIKQAKRLFSNKRRRFAGIAVDVLFDHYLIKHWQSFHSLPLSQFKQTSYQLLNEQLPYMPGKMQQVITRMTQNDWLKEYETLDGVGTALDNIARRIRFSNEFTNAIEDITCHYQTLEARFLIFFPELIQHVKEHQLEMAHK